MDIEKLSLEQLIELNRRIVRRIRYLSEIKTGDALRKFEIGDRVSFQNEGRTVEGMVVRVNQKTATIQTKEGSWRIPPRFLTKVDLRRLPQPLDLQSMMKMDPSEN